MKESFDLISSVAPSGFDVLHLKRLWQRAMLARDRAQRPRIVQYINMFANRRDANDAWR